MQLSRDELLSAYRTMAAARHFEESVYENFSDGKIPGFVHLSAGQEATAAGVYMALDERDWIATTHRAHGQCIARGLDLQETMDEIYGATTGVCGRQGRLDAHRRPRQGHAGRERDHRRDRPFGRGCRPLRKSQGRERRRRGLLRGWRFQPGVDLRSLQHGEYLEASGDLHLRRQRLCRGDPLILFGGGLAGGPRERLRNARRRGRRVRLLRGPRCDERGRRTRPRMARARA